MVNILIADDEQKVRNVISNSLKKSEYDVSEASNGIEAIERVKETSIDAAIIDIFMPDKEGVETIIELRRISEKLPILAISGGGRTEKMYFLKVSKLLGADSIMMKPFTPSELIMELGSLIQRKTVQPDFETSP